jgi:hypothetical protein
MPGRDKSSRSSVKGGGRESLLDQHRDSINECLRLHRPGTDLVDTKIDSIRIIAPLPLIKQAIIERPLAKWQQPRADQMLMEERAGLGSHNTTPSRSTCCVNGMARYKGEFHV